jgi:site-specific DNA recombinase
VLEIEKSIATETAKLNRLRDELAALERELLSEDDIQAALQAFDPAWNALKSEEQATAIRNVIERIDYDGPSGRLTVQFRSAALKAICGRATGKHTHAG